MDDFAGTGESCGRVSIGMAEASSANTVADIIGVFRNKYPQIRFELFTAMADEVLERIDKGILDIGFLLEPINVDKYDFVRLHNSERLGVLMRTDDDLSSKSDLSPEDLLGLPLIIMRRELQQNTRNILSSVYDKYDIIATYNVVNNSMLLAERGIGYVLIVEGATRTADTAVPIKG